MCRGRLATIVHIQQSVAFYIQTHAHTHTSVAILAQAYLRTATESVTPPLAMADWLRTTSLASAARPADESGVLNLNERRIAWDGEAYTFEEFATHYGFATGLARWRSSDSAEQPVTATVSSAAKPVVEQASEHAQPIQRMALDGNSYTEQQQEGHSQRVSETTGANPRASESASSAEKPAVMLQHQAVGTTSMLTLNCPICERVLCATDDLAFFYRNNKQDGTEVHLMLKPEKTVPKTFQPSAKLEPGAVHSWSCDCGAKLRDTRHVGPGKAPMTAFKSASVILCGQSLPGKKSKWPTVYDKEPFRCIEVRNRDTFWGHMDGGATAPVLCWKTSDVVLCWKTRTHM